MKICSKCKKEKNLEDFSFHSKKLNTYQSRCKECVLGHKPYSWLDITEKACSKCLIIKPLGDFSKRKQVENRVYRYAECKKCINKRKTDRRMLNPEKELLRIKKVKMYTKYKLRYPEYLEILISQEGKCKICKTTLENPCIDHNHSTGKVRGLLCTGCNSGIGMLKENIENLKAAIQYIQDN